MKTFTMLLALAVTSFLPALGQSVVPNVEQVPGRLLAGVIDANQGRTAVLEIHEGYLWSAPESPGSLAGSHQRIQCWDFSGLAGETPETRLINVQPKQTFSVSRGPLDSHGSLKSGNQIHLGNTNQSYHLDLITGDFVEGAKPNWVFAGTRADAFSPWSMTKFDNYTPIPSEARFWDYRHGQANNDDIIASWDHQGLTGVIGHSFIIGNIMYVGSEASRSGIAAYDMRYAMDTSLPIEERVPVLLSVLTEGAPGGYQPEMWAGDGKLYMVFPYRTGGNGVRVADVTDPNNMQMIADFQIQSADQSMYVQFQDHYAFVCGSKIDMRTFEEVLTLDLANTPQLNAPGQVGFSASQYSLPAGNLLITGGYAEGQGASIWAHQAEPDTTPPSVAYHTPKHNETNYPLRAPVSLIIHETLEIRSIVNGDSFKVCPVLEDGSLGEALAADIAFSYNDFLTFTPHQPFLPATTYEVQITEGGIKDVVGNGMEAYSFRFSTGAGIDANNEAPVISSVNVTTSPSEAGEEIGFVAVAEDVDAGDVLEYRFDAGDGSARTAWQVGNGFTHSYAETGHYNIVMQVRDSHGVVRSSARKVTVSPPAPTALPARSAQMALTETGIWIVNPDNDSVTHIDKNTRNVVEEIPTGKDPRSVALADDGTLWVCCHDSDEIRVYAQDGSIQQTLQLPYGSAPIALCATLDRGTILCSLAGSGRLLKFNTTSRTEVGNLYLGPTSRAIAVTADGERALVTRFISPEHHGEVWDVAVAPFTLTRTIVLHKNRGGRVVQDTTGGARGVPNYLAGVSISPDGSRAWVASKQDNTDRGMLSGGYLGDFAHDDTVRAIISQIDLQTNREIIDNSIEQTSLTTVSRIDVDNAAQPKEIAYSPLGDYMFVAMEGNNAIVVYDALTFEKFSTAVVLGRIEVGRAPQSLLVDPVSNTLWVKNFLDRTVSVIDLELLTSSGSIVLPQEIVGTAFEEKLAAQTLLGKRVFYHAGDARMSAEGYMSCASCHADGGHDGRNWDLSGRGEGVRNTIPLAGRGGIEHGLLHWSANFDEVQDFENDIRNAFGGKGFLSDEHWSDPSIQAPLGAGPKAGRSVELDALAAYLRSLDSNHTPRSPHREEDGSMTTSALAGQSHFTALNCASCHVPSTGYRDGLSHDVGTRLPLSGLGLTGVDTPTLVDLSHTSPYLHHGVASSLEDVFRIAGGTTYEAEEMTPVGGGVNRLSRSSQATNLLINHDNTSYGGLATISVNGSGLQVGNVDGGAGGSAGVLIRAYSTRTAPHTFVITANPGTAHESTTTAVLTATRTNTGFKHIWAEGLTLQPGASNVVRITANAGWPNLVVDQITITNVDDLAQANAHRVALTLSESDRAELVDYLQQLGEPVEQPLPLDLWKQQHFPDEFTDPSVGGDLADPDNDGLDNMTEYFLGSDPNSADPSNHPGGDLYEEGGVVYLRYRFQRDLSAFGNTFSIQVSTNLEIWSDSVNHIEREVSRDGNIQLLEVLIPIENEDTRQFVRLSVER